MLQNNNAKGLSGIDLLVAMVSVVLLGTLYFAVTPTVHRCGGASGISRVRSDMRSLATAIETYYVDHDCYPAMTMQLSEVADAPHYLPKTGAVVGRTFRAAHDTGLATLTTPVSYVTSNFRDPSADSKGTHFRYFTDGPGWILGAYGPDRDEKSGGQLGWNIGDVDLPERNGGGVGFLLLRIALGDFDLSDWSREGIRPPDEFFDEGVERVYDNTFSQPSVRLITGAGPRGAYTYDPTNGTLSAGDLWRVKQ